MIQRNTSREPESGESWEREQTIDELNDLIRLAEKAAQRLAHESHFEAYGEAHALLDMLRHVRAAAETIRRKQHTH